MAAQRFVDLLNEQIGHEYAAHQQYVAIAVYYDTLTMPQMAGLFYRQAIEERDHAMMMVQYLLDTDSSVSVPGVAAPTNTFADIAEPVQLALAQEKRVSEQINALTAVAREEHDFASDQFMQWFIKEQVEEVSSMSDLLTVVQRNRVDVENIEEYLRREASTEEADASAPPVAGAGA
jgi:bacterioferritin B